MKRSVAGSLVVSDSRLEEPGPISRLIEGRIVSSRDFADIGGDVGFLFQIKKAVSLGTDAPVLSARQWRLSGGGEPGLYGSADFAAADLTMRLKHGLQQIRKFPVDERCDPEVVYTVLEKALDNTRHSFRGLGAQDVDLTASLMTASVEVARGHHGLATTGVAYSDPDAVRMFLDREIVFSRAMRSSDPVVVADARQTRKDEAFGDDPMTPTRAAMRAALKPMTGRHFGEEVLILPISQQEVHDIKTILDRGHPTYTREEKITRIDAFGEAHESVHAAGSPRRAAIAYVIANNMNAIQSEIAAMSIVGDMDLGNSTRHISLKVEVLARNAEKSTAPGKFLTILKEAVGDGRKRQTDVEKAVLRTRVRDVGMEL